MPATPFKPLSWNPDDPITETKLDQIANNSQWLFENTPRASYEAYGVKRTTGVKLACGAVIIYASKAEVQTRPVYFSNFFSTASKPIVTTSVTSFQRAVFVTINGFGVYQPDHRGFEAVVEMRAKSGAAQISQNFYVNWIAMGF